LYATLLCRNLHLLGFFFAVPDLVVAPFGAGWNTPMAVFDLSGQQAAVPKIRLRPRASVARFHEKVSKLLHLNKLLDLCIITCSLVAHICSAVPVCSSGYV